MFYGERSYRIDPKGRVPIPPEFRGEFREGVMLMEGAEKCVIVCPPSLWRKLSDSYATSYIGREKQRRLNRALFASASSERLDTQGRVPLPPSLRQYAGIGGEAVVVGANTYLELWDKTAWEEEQGRLRAERWQILESMEDGK